MLEHLQSPPGEALLQIAQDYAADERTNKIDLGVGVYRNGQGLTPVMHAVKLAEQQIASEQTTKSYVGLLGNVGFSQSIIDMLLGDASQPVRHAALQTPGGSGALRLLFDLIKLANPNATVWLPDPTWANHLPVIEQVGLNYNTYPYYNYQTGNIEFSALLDCLAKLGANDVVVLHGCCHNPTGASLDHKQWDAIAELIQSRGFIPLIDLAYQGFGTGLTEDAYGVTRLYECVEEMLLAYSCSKNFAIYRERTGLALSISSSADNTARALGQMKYLARTNHSMPPDHGAEVVHTILNNSKLKILWQDELEQMRKRVQTLRNSLVSAFREKTNRNDFDCIGQQQGLFSLLGCSRDDVKRLRHDHAIYMAPDSRMNIAGLTNAQVQPLVDAVCTLH